MNLYIIFPILGRISSVGKNTWVGNGDEVAVGGNHTGVGVTVANGRGVPVGRVGVGVLAGAKEHAAKSILMLRIEIRYFIFFG